MEFKSKKEEYIYYTKLCMRAKESKDEEVYLFCLERMERLLKEIEESKK